MKKFFEKYDLVAIIGFAILFVFLLTWIIPSGYFNGVEFVSYGIKRIGLNDLFLTGMYSINYFVLQLTYLLVIGGFYGLLTKTASYKNLVAKLAKFVKGHAVISVLFISFIMAVITSIANDIFLVLIFVPFIISILRNAKLDKLTTFSATFGGILIGIIGATYSSAAYSFVNEYMGTTLTTLMWAKVVIFFLAYALFNLFTVLHMRKAESKKSNEELEEFSEEVKEDKKAKTWPAIVIMSIVFIFVVLGFVSWNANFQINIFNDFHTWLTGLKIGEHAIFAYILGNSQAFGTWDLSSLQMILLLLFIPLWIMTKQSFVENVDSVVAGIKKMLKPLVVVFLINSLFILVYWSPIVPTISNWIMGLTESFNVFGATIVGIISSVFHVDYAYSGFTLGAWLAGAFGEFKDVIMIILNSTHGLVSFIAPTSLVLMLGLAYSNIKYSTWFKYIWKFLLGMLILLLIIFVILTFMV